jgi:type IV pilus biogenesis/stability protein PilW
MRPTIPSLAALALALATLAACASGPTVKQRQSAEIHHDLAVEALKAGRPQDAMREYDTALKLDPDLPQAHLGRGLVLEHGFGRTGEAEAEYRRAIASKPAYSDAHNNLGQLLARTGRYEEAIKHFDEALLSTFYMEPWVARCNKGQALYRMGKRDDGLAELRACVTIAPRYCAGRRELGRLLLGEGKVKESLEELAAYARHCEKVPDAHYQLGLAQMKAGDLPAATQAFERCEALGGDAAIADECRKSRTLLQ